ncbi:Qnr family pentapeptide repeat protein [Vibrio sp. Of14-4]|uniref:Qnr family pentapeptide repeat protein n=1 Tax=Vibrio sp. Of14-4 TaxID=2724878 RepID=UPI001EF1D5FC|nr:Qnr family pentapeptide repeat protein [Vibrio sp. Of14-4]MCG7489221.1 Qnr family pentapeptide repeat protein [Vibrio sp. Of14-4]
MTIKNKTYRQQDFSHQDLQYAVYEDCQFIQCEFDRADLRNAKFINCRFIEAQALEGSSFFYAKLKDTSFTNCMLAMSQFVGADCFGIEFRKCDLKGANFQRANFINRISDKVYFCSAYITGCNLSYVNLERALLEKCDLYENRWTEANLDSASFLGSDLSRGEFSIDQWGSFNIEGADLTHVDLEGVDVCRVSLDGVKICRWQQDQLLDKFGLIVID